MSRFNLLRRRSVRVALVLAFLVSAAAGFFTAGTTDALPCNEVERLYFDGPSHTNIVGERILFCNGQTFKWGIVTPYVQIFTTSCGNCGN